MQVTKRLFDLAYQSDIALLCELGDGKVHKKRFSSFMSVHVLLTLIYSLEASLEEDPEGFSTFTSCR